MAAPVVNTRICCALWALSTLFLSDTFVLALDNSMHDVTGAELDSLTETTEHVLALFYDGTCGTRKCKDALDQLLLVTKDTTLPALKVVKISSTSKVAEYGIEALPNLIFFHNGSPNLYPGKEIEVEAVLEWTEGTPEEILKELDDNSFEHLTQAGTGATTGDWFIIFYESHCSSLLPTMRAVANRLRHRVIVGHVHILKSPGLQQRFNIVKCPTLIFFHHGNMYEYTIPKHDLESLVLFAEGWYKNAKAVKVPTELSPFDHMVEYIAISLKKTIEEEKGLPLLVGGGIVILVLLLICCCCCASANTRQKHE